MKQLIFIIITFMFVSNAYAQTATEIITKGEVLNLGAQGETSLLKAWHVIYKKTYYVCLANHESISCQAPKDYGSDGLKD